MRLPYYEFNLWPDFAATSVALLLGSLLICADLFFGIDLFNFVINILSQLHIGTHEIDEFILLIMLVLLGGAIDLFQRHSREKRQHTLNADRLRTMRTTMATVEDIVNNLLNNLEYLRFTAARGAPLDEEALKLLDEQIRLTTGKLNKLSEMDIFVDKDLGQGLKCINLDKNPK